VSLVSEHRSAEAVFVFADDGLRVFRDVAAVRSYIEAPDVADGVYEAIFTLNGEVIRADAAGANVVLTPTGDMDLPGLTRRVRDNADHFMSDPADLPAVAAEVLNAEWDARWPTRPRWLNRRLHGDRPPQPGAAD
jgi:hypothetical protein